MIHNELFWWNKIAHVTTIIVSTHTWNLKFENVTTEWRISIKNILLENIVKKWKKWILKIFTTKLIMMPILTLAEFNNDSKLKNYFNICQTIRE